MATRHKYPLLRLKSNNYENYEIVEREPRERIRIFDEVVQIDRLIFKKSRAEKELLKLAKMQCKIDEMNEQ